MIMFVVVFCIISVCCGAARQQVISFYRFSSFMYAPMLCLCLLPCALLPKWGNWRCVMLSIGLLGAVCGREILANESFERQLASMRSANEMREWIRRRDDLLSILANSKRLLSGRYSLQDAYQNQQGWPGRMPWGGIYPPMVKVREVLGPNVPVYTLHIHSYSMLPNCDMRAFMSSRTPMSALLTGTAEELRCAFEAEGIRYFFISNELQVACPMPLCALFAPETIGHYLGVKWTDGTSYLLTWLSEDTQPLDSSFLNRYAQQVRESPHVQNFPIDDWQRAFSDYFREGGLKAQRLPWYHRGWKGQ